MAERSSAPTDSSSGVSDQQGVGLSPGLDTCVLEEDTSPLLFCPWETDLKPQVPCIVNPVRVSLREGGFAAMISGMVGSRLLLSAV